MLDIHVFEAILNFRNINVINKGNDYIDETKFWGNSFYKNRR